MAGGCPGDRAAVMSSAIQLQRNAAPPAPPARERGRPVVGGPSSAAETVTANSSDDVVRGARATWPICPIGEYFCIDALQLTVALVRRVTYAPTKHFGAVNKECGRGDGSPHRPLVASLFRTRRSIRTLGNHVDDQ